MTTISADTTRDTSQDSGKAKVLIALFVLYLVVGFAERAFVGSTHWLDPDGWIETAQTLCSHGEYGVQPGSPSLRRSPAYPTALAAGCMFKDGRPDLIVPIINALCHVGLLFLLFQHPIVRTLSAPKLAVLVIGLDPMILNYAGRTYVEPMLIFSVGAILVAFSRYVENASRTNAALLAGAWAFSLLVKPIMMYLPVLLAPLALWGGRPKAPLAHIALFVLVPLIITGPWLYRNYQISGAPTLQTGGPTQIIKGETFARLTLEGVFTGQEEQALRELSELTKTLQIQNLRNIETGTEMESALSEYLKQDIIENPGKHVTKVVTQAFSFWFLGGSAIQTAAYTVLAVPVLILALYAVFFTLGLRNIQVWAIVLTVGYFVAVHAVILALARYSVPVRPWVVLLAICAVLSLMRKYLPKTHAYLERFG